MTTHERALWALRWHYGRQIAATDDGTETDWESRLVMSLKEIELKRQVASPHGTRVWP